jgi:hypothetical protein
MRILGIGAVFTGLALCLIGIVTLPERGGLFFALPFVFLFPGVLLLLLGGLAIFFTRRTAPPDRVEVERG